MKNKTITKDNYSITQLRIMLDDLKKNKAAIKKKFDALKNELLNNTTLGYYQVQEKNKLLINHGSVIKLANKEINIIQNQLKKMDLDNEDWVHPKTLLL